jgi:hypothetical protein
LNRLNILNGFQRVRTTPPSTVLARPACQCPTVTPPRLPLSLRTPPLTPGPVATRPHLSAASPVPLRFPRFVSPPPSRAHAVTSDRTTQSHSDPMVWLPTPHRPPLSPFLPPPCGTPEPTPPFPPLLSPRARRFGEHAGASLCSVPRPILSSSSPPSPPRMHPTRWLLQPEIPPPLRFPSERHCLHHFTVRPPIHHRCPQWRPPSPSLFCTNTTGLCLHRRRPPELPPR